MVARHRVVGIKDGGKEIRFRSTASNMQKGVFETAECALCLPFNMMLSMAMLKRGTEDVCCC
jgi:hypothetical protein